MTFNLSFSFELINKDEVNLSDPDRKFISIRVKNTDSKVDLNTPFENAYLLKVKNVDFRISFMKSIYGNSYIAILGALGEPGNTVKVLTETGKNLGVFKVLDSTSGNVLKSIKKVKGNSTYDLYLFDKKI